PAAKKKLAEGWSSPYGKSPSVSTASVLLEPSDSPTTNASFACTPISLCVGDGTCSNSNCGVACAPTLRSTVTFTSASPKDANKQISSSCVFRLLAKSLPIHPRPDPGCRYHQRVTRPEARASTTTWHLCCSVEQAAALPPRVHSKVNFKIGLALSWIVLLTHSSAISQ